MKKMILMATVFAMLLSTMVFAAEGGDERKGKFIYKKIYKTCFEKGTVTSEKPPVSPDAKTQAQWDAEDQKRRDRMRAAVNRTKTK